MKIGLHARFGGVCAAVAAAVSVCAGTFSPAAGAASEAPAVVGRTVPIRGKQSHKGWTYYGGSFWVNDFALSRDGSAVWLATPVGLVRYDLQDGALRRWTTFDGLADNTVYDVVGDGDGNVWAATMSGVSRFDGERFRSWYREDIGHHAFGRIAADMDGRIWVGCTGRYRFGAFCRQPGGSWVHYSAWALHENGGFLNDVLDIAADPRGGVWLCGTYGGLSALEGSYRYHTPWGPNLYYVDLHGTANLVALPREDEQPVWPDALAFDGQGACYMLARRSAAERGGGDLYRLAVTNVFAFQGREIPDTANVEWDKVPCPAGAAGNVHAIAVDDAGALWLATPDGFGPGAGDAFAAVVPMPVPKLARHYESFTVRFCVFNGGTELLCCFAGPTGFYHWKHGAWVHVDAELDGPVRGGRGFPIIGRTGRGPDGSMYFVRNTTTVFDGRTWTDLERRTHFVWDKQERVKALLWRDAARGANMIRLQGADKAVTVESLFGRADFEPAFVDGQGHYWQLGDVVLEYDGKRFIDHVSENPYLFRRFPGYYNRRASRIAEDARGRVFVATQWGLLRREQGTQWSVAGSKFKGMLGMSLWQWASDGRDTIAFGGPWGASIYNTERDEWRNVIRRDLSFPDTEPEFPGSMVEYAAADLEDRIWYGFYEAGVVCRRRNGEQIHYTTRDGLPNGSVWGIWADDDGAMWFNTFSGTCRFDPAAVE